MTKEEYIKKLKEDEGWCPGIEAIENEFDRLYPGQKVDHYMTKLASRAFFGGDEYLDGCSIYENENGYFHLVSFGMSELYGHEDLFGREYSKWGYEMTIRLREEKPEDCVWAIQMLLNLARYTYQTGRYLEPEQFVIGDGSPIHLGTDSKLTSLIIIPDISAQTQQTVHGLFPCAI